MYEYVDHFLKNVIQFWFVILPLFFGIFLSFFLPNFVFAQNFGNYANLDVTVNSSSSAVAFSDTSTNNFISDVPWGDPFLATERFYKGTFPTGDLLLEQSRTTSWIGRSGMNIEGVTQIANIYPSPGDYWLEVQVDNKIGIVCLNSPTGFTSWTLFDCDIPVTFPDSVYPDIQYNGLYPNFEPNIVFDQPTSTFQVTPPNTVFSGEYLNTFSSVDKVEIMFVTRPAFEAWFIDNEQPSVDDVEIVSFDVDYNATDYLPFQLQLPSDPFGSELPNGRAYWTAYFVDSTTDTIYNSLSRTNPFDFSTNWGYLDWTTTGLGVDEGFSLGFPPSCSFQGLNTVQILGSIPSCAWDFLVFLVTPTKFPVDYFDEFVAFWDDFIFNDTYLLGSTLNIPFDFWDIVTNASGSGSITPVEWSVYGNSVQLLNQQTLEDINTMFPFAKTFLTWAFAIMMLIYLSNAWQRFMQVDVFLPNNVSNLYRD